MLRRSIRLASSKAKTLRPFGSLNSIVTARPTSLASHPEGGRFRRVFRSASFVDIPASDSFSQDSATVSHNHHRSALTHIYFELDNKSTDAKLSHFHRVRDSDEVWNLYRGAVRLWLWDGEDELVWVELRAQSERFCQVVPAGVWQAAEVIGDCDGEALVGCTVAPGFEFANFEQLSEGGDAEGVAFLKSKGLERFLR